MNGKWFLGVFGVAALGAIFSSGILWGEVAHNTTLIAEARKKIEGVGERLRNLETGQGVIQEQNKTAIKARKDLKDQQKEQNKKLDTILREIRQRR